MHDGTRKFDQLIWSKQKESYIQSIVVDLKMSKSCCIEGCPNTYDRNSGISMHRIPSIFSAGNKKYSNFVEDVVELSKIRQKAWKKVMKCDDLSELEMKNIKICSAHFISGKPADFPDCENPDWLPNQNLGHDPPFTPEEKAELDRQRSSMKKGYSDGESSIWEPVLPEGSEKNPIRRSQNTFHFADATVKANHRPRLKRSRQKDLPPIAEPPESQNILKKSKNLDSPKILDLPKTPYFGTSVKSHSPTSRKMSKSQYLLSSLIPGDTTPGAENEKLNEILARAIYSSSVPMDMTENIYWKRFFENLRDSWNPPSAADIRGYLLENEYNRLIAAAQRKVIKAHSLVMSSYGWASPKGEIHFVLHTPEPVFCKCLIAEGEKDANFISTKIIEMIKKVGFHKLMILFIDGGPNLEEARKIIGKTYPHITIFVSRENDAKLILKDVTKLKTIQEILRKAREMIQSIDLTDTVSTEGQKKSYVRSDAASTLKTLLENKSAFEADFADEMMPEEVRQNIIDEDKDFWNDVEKLSGLLELISEKIDFLEGNQSLLSDVPNIFRVIHKRLLAWIHESLLLQNKEKIEIRAKFLARMRSAVKPIHCAANLLDPKFRGGNLDDKDTKSAIDFLDKQCDYLVYEKELVFANLEDYRNSTGPFSRGYLWGVAKNISPVDWWTNFCKNMSIYRLATQLLSISPNFIARQRFSEGMELNPNHGLNTQSLEKLITIKANLTMSQNSENKTMSSIFES